MPGGKAALRQMIDDLRRSAPSYPRMSPYLAGKMRQQLPEIQSVLGALGTPESIFFRGVGPDGNDLYGVKFSNGWGGDPAGPSTVRRTTPLPGSDEALQRYIDGIQEALPTTSG
jgi:hypothetical protein